MFLISPVKKDHSDIHHTFSFDVMFLMSLNTKNFSLSNNLTIKLTIHVPTTPLVA